MKYVLVKMDEGEHVVKYRNCIESRHETDSDCTLDPYGSGDCYCNSDNCNDEPESKVPKLISNLNINLLL